MSLTLHMLQIARACLLTSLPPNTAVASRACLCVGEKACTPHVGSRGLVPSNIGSPPELSTEAPHITPRTMTAA